MGQGGIYMGLFKKEICFVCQNEIKKKPIKMKSSGSYLCQDCCSFIGSDSISLVRYSDEQIISIYNQKLEKERITNELKKADPLRTAEGMYNFMLKNGIRSEGKVPKILLDNFKVIEDNLHNDEDIKLTFTGILNMNGLLGEGGFSFALTDKRFIYAMKTKSIEKIKSVNIDNVNDLTYSQGVSLGKITVDTIKETFSISVEAHSAKIVFEKINEILNELKNKEKSEMNVSTASPSPADEIKKYKELLDLGILTQEEFDQKKKDLLNL